MGYYRGWPGIKICGGVIVKKWLNIANALLVLAVVVLIGVVKMSGSRTPITKEGFGNIPTLIEYDPVRTTISNQAAETTLYEVEIPRNSLGLTDRAVRVELDYLGYNNSGAARTIVWRVYYGTSAALVLPTKTWAVDARYFSGKLVVWLTNDGAVNSQFVHAWDRDDPFIYNTDGWAQDSNKDLNLKITADFSAASANLQVIQTVAVTTQMQP